MQARTLVFSLLLLSTPALAQPRAPRMTVEGLKEPGAHLTDLGGHDVSAELQPRREGDTVSVSLAHPGPFIVKSREVGHVAADGSHKLTLPGGVVMPLVAAADGSGHPPSMTWFRPTLLPSPMPAVWDESSGEYVTRLTFGLERKSDAPVTLALEQPVMFKLGYEGLTARDLEPVVIDGSGLDHEKTIELRFLPRTPHPTLLVRSSITDTNVELQALPRLELRPVQAKILGFGLGLTDILVEQVQPDGERLPATREVMVGLEINGRATPEPREVTFKAGAADALFKLRSAGLGPVTVRASANGIGGRTSIDQQFPYGPLVSALLGGTLGGLCRRFVRGARRKSSPRLVVEGLLVGSIAFVAGVLGVGYLGLPAAVVATEAGAFLTGALTGFGGVTGLEMMTKKLRPPDDRGGEAGNGPVAATS
jgi:hypothetical protein